MIELKPHAEGVLLPVRAQPNARKPGVLGEVNGALKVAVGAPPEDGKANAAIVELLREFFALKKSQIELISGKANRNKVFLLRSGQEGVQAILSSFPGR